MSSQVLAVQPDRAAWRRRLSAFAMLCMETLALFVLGNLLAGPGRRPGPNVAILLCAALAGYGLVRLLQHFDLPRPVLLGAGATLTCAGLWLLASLQYSDGPFTDSGLILFAANPGRALNGHVAQVFGVLVIALAWARGAVIGSWPRLTQRAVLASLTIGLGIVFIGLTFGHGSISSQAIDAAALPFFCIGLLTLALLQLGQSEHIRGDSWRGPWLLVLLGTSAALALVGAAVGLLPLGLLNPLFALVGTVALSAFDILLYIIVYPFAVVATWILIHALGPHIHATNFQIQVPTQDPRQLQHQAHQTAAGALAATVGHIVLLALIIGAVVLVLLWLFRRVERDPSAEEPQRETVEGENALRSDLEAMLSGLFRRLRRPGPLAEPELSPSLREIRRLYLRLLRRSEARGLDRPPATTPREFAPALEQHFASALPGELTEQFARARYGRIEPDSAEMERLKQGIDQIR